MEHFPFDTSDESLSFLLSEDLDLDFDLDFWRSDDFDLLCLDFREDSLFSPDFVTDL